MHARNVFVTLIVEFRGPVIGDERGPNLQN